MDKNTGVTIGGDARLSGSAIGGHDATVTNTSGPRHAAPPGSLPELREALTDLLGEICRATDGSADQDDIVAAVEQARAEAEKDRPNRHLLVGLLHAVGKAVVGIGSLAGVVTALEAAATSILGG
ncbi:hypothetical protein OG874_21030 [Nocardia sp. NBC_00565]|uniref:hypothetical protein n=1 Tax=Nocardia sp. NBC_00565 TaxID=2975993 RepID=UPI002E7FF4CC|nr:hypothetical protein [Nocardia sp. NBC_00565]WUC07420.1 hypothetical protein OG874_21030 [Nocardia sp. NBC_00565]